MTSRRALACVTLGVLAFTLGACSDEQSSADSSSSTSSSVLDSTTSSDVTTSTTVAPSTSTSTSTTTSTTTAPTTSTVPPVKGLDVSGEGLGGALFGAEADGVVAYVSSILGDPTNDSGWEDPLAIGAACNGTSIRFVDWTDLRLYFSDDSPAAQGLRHFAAFNYGPASDGVALNPNGLATANGVGVGATVEFLRASYPQVQISPGDDIGGPSFFIDEGLSGFLSGTSNADVIISFVGGYGCGE